MWWLACIPLAQAQDRDDREALEGVVDRATSEHFVLKWGADYTPAPDAIADTLGLLETAWDVEFEALGFDRPLGTDRYLFNVYVVNSGVAWPGQPPFVWDDVTGGALVPSDPQGYPFLLVNSYAFEGDALPIIAAHELFHGSQHATGNYGIDSLTHIDHLWWIEATAVWAMYEVYPEENDTFAGLWTLDFAPELALETVNPQRFYTGQSVALPAYEKDLQVDRFYALGTFPIHLSERYVPDLVHRVWSDDGGHDRPLDRIEEVLAEEGVTLDEAVHSWAVANRTWDYAAGATWSAWVEEDFADRVERFGYPADAREQADRSETLVVDGSRAWFSPEEERRPGRYGSNHVVLRAPEKDVIRVELDGDEVGTEGTPVRWLGTALAIGAEGDVLDSVPLEDGRARLTGARDADEVVVVLTAATDTFVDGEQFGYRIRLQQKNAGLGCQTAPPAWPALFGLVLFGLRRRDNEERACDS